jgi:hypothetical protein
MTRKAEALKKSSANPEVAAAADAAVADLSKKAAAVKKALASGKTDAAHAIDDTLASVAQAADSLKQSGHAAGVGDAVKGLTGGRGSTEHAGALRMQASVAAGCTLLLITEHALQLCLLPLPDACCCCVSFLFLQARARTSRRPSSLAARALTRWWTRRSPRSASAPPRSS